MTSDWEGKAKTDTSGWSYAADFTDTKDQIRARIGDMDEDDPLLLDDEIEAAYDEAESVIDGALLAARWAAARLARSYDRKIGKMSMSHSQRHAQMLQTIESLKDEIREASSTWSVPSSIGTVSDVSNYPRVWEHSDA